MFRGGGKKRGRGPPTVSYTQEECSADVFWGDSPPIDDFAELLDSETQEMLPTIIQDEEWTAPVPKRNKVKSQTHKSKEATQRGQRSADADAITALLSPSKDSRAVHFNSNSEGFFDKSFNSEDSFVSVCNVNSDENRNIPNADYSKKSPHTDTQNDTVEISESKQNDTDESFTEYDFELLDALVAKTKQQKEKLSQSLSPIPTSDSQPELTDSSILPISQKFSLQPFMPTESSVSTQTRDFLQNFKGNPQESNTLSKKNDVHTINVSVPSYPGATRTPPTVDNKEINEAAGNTMSQNPYHLKRQQALERRRLSKEKLQTQHSGRQEESTIHRDQNTQQSCLLQQPRMHPLPQKQLQQQLQQNKATSVQQQFQHDRQARLPVSYSSLNISGTASQRMGNKSLDHQTSRVVPQSVKSTMLNSNSSSDVDDFAALEAMMSKYDNPNKKPEHVHDVRVHDKHNDDDLSEFDAIEAMMTSVESQYFSSGKENESSKRATRYNEVSQPASIPGAYDECSNAPKKVYPGKLESQNLGRGMSESSIQNSLGGNNVYRNLPPSRVNSYPAYSRISMSYENDEKSRPIYKGDPVSTPPLHCFRFIVLDVNATVDSSNQVVKRIRCLNYYHNSSDISSAHCSTDNVSVFLHEDWAGCEVRGGDIIHLVMSISVDDFTDAAERVTVNNDKIDDTQLPTELHVNNTRGLLVLHPDVLVSPTKISDSFFCSRKAVLSDRIRGNSSSNQAAVLGSLKHQFIEQLIKLHLTQMKNNTEEVMSGNIEASMNLNDDEVKLYGVSQSRIENLVKIAICDQRAALFSVDISDADATSALWAVAEGTSNWIKERCHFTSDIRTKNCDHMLEWNDMESWEEMLWSPVLGVKGQIDMVLQARDMSTDKSDYRFCSVPVELKTGKWRPNNLIGHRAQAMLYVLMMTLRSKSDQLMMGKASSSPMKGLLLYLGNEESKCEVISPQWAEVRGLIISRNKLAVSLKNMVDVKNLTSGMRTSLLPPLLKSPSCNWCFSAAECMLYHRAATAKASVRSDSSVESPISLIESAETSGNSDLFNFLTRDIDVHHVTFFKHWDRLLDIENKATAQTSHPQSGQLGIWTDPIRCVLFSLRSTDSDYARSLCLSEGNASLFSSDDSKYVWTFCQEFDNSSGSLRDMDFAVGDRISLSVDKTILNNSTGECGDIENGGGMKIVEGWNVANIEPYAASGALMYANHETLCIGFSQLSKRLISIGNAIVRRESRGLNSQWLFRLNKEEFTMPVISTLRSNLIRLLTVPHDPKKFSVVKSSKVSNDNPSNVADDMKSQARLSINHLRSLVVDLMAPKFIPLYNEAFSPVKNKMDVDIQLFFPCLNPLQLMFIQSLSQNEGQRNICRTTQKFCEVSPSLYYEGCHPLRLLEEYRKLNSGQQNVVKKVLSSMDYTLLLGMPGTGKTSTLSFVIRALVARGERILITSYTNNAVDNLMTKLRDSGVSPSVMGRLGRVGSVDRVIESYCLLNDNNSTVKELSERLNGCRIIATTILTAARSNILQKLGPFDWCVMDEAGQISQPAALGGMLLAKKHLLVGDNYQLPPLVISLEAQVEGMEVSMFKRLGEAHPNAVVCLTAQYRMNADIMAVSNALIYEYRLHCGNQSVAEARLNYTRQTEVLDMLPYTNNYWLQRCLAVENSVVFINTDSIRGGEFSDRNTSLILDEVQARTMPVQFDGRECEICDSDVDRSASNVKKKAIHNPTEVAIISLILQGLALCGLEDLESSVGIVSPYRAQVRSIQKALLRFSDFDISDFAGEELRDFILDCILTKPKLEDLVNNGVSTVDKFQGRDMNVVILSMVRSNSRKQVGDLLRDWRRVNVALTRAKRKLLIIGSLEMMECVPVLKELKRLVQNNNWVVDVPEQALCRNTILDV